MSRLLLSAVLLALALPVSAAPPATIPTADAIDAPPPAPPSPIALVIHGGAGVIERNALSPEDERAVRADLDRALDAGHAVLAKGGNALDAVTAAVLVLEDSPWFNAGKGAVFNAEGGHELDAAIMEGPTRRAGAVAGVTTVRNPVLLARAVMEHSPHVMLAGEGAEAFADTRPEIRRVRPDWFDTERRRQQLEAAKLRERRQEASARESRWGTVGAVALDMQGRLAAATSTGGMTNKRWGRIGDAPVIGAGTWAEAGCAVSATGWGEFYLRTAAARTVCARVALKGESLDIAAHGVINGEIPAYGGDGGAIAMDAQGNISMPFNTPGMYRGWVKTDGTRGTAVFADPAE